MKWTRIMWTEARQLTGILGWPPEAGDLVPPQAYFEDLRASGRRHEAAMFLGQALPRFEAVVWATHAVRELTPNAISPADADALKATLLWLQDPSEVRRRAAFDASQLARTNAPERLCALAAFYSGGSIAPDGLEPVPAPKDAAGRLAAGAALLAAVDSGGGSAALDQILDMGAALAQGRAVETA